MYFNSTANTSFCCQPDQTPIKGRGISASRSSGKVGVKMSTRYQLGRRDLQKTAKELQIESKKQKKLDFITDTKRKFYTSRKAVAGKSKTALLVSRAAGVKKTALQLSMKSRLRVTTQAVRTAVEREQQFMSELRAKYSDHKNIRLGVKRCYMLKSQPKLKCKPKRRVSSMGEKDVLDEKRTKCNVSRHCNQSVIKHFLMNKLKKLRPSTQFRSAKFSVKSAESKLPPCNGRFKSNSNKSTNKRSGSGGKRTAAVVQAEADDSWPTQTDTAGVERKKSLSTSPRRSDTTRAKHRQLVAKDELSTTKQMKLDRSKLLSSSSGKHSIPTSSRGSLR